MTNLLYALSRLDALSLIDIGLVALVIYAVLFAIRGTPAVNLLRGLLVIVGATVALTTLLQLTALTWLVRNMLPALLVALPVIFQPELRRALEQLGQASGWFSRTAATQESQRAITEIGKAATALSRQRIGALIAIEQRGSLQHYAETGVILNARVSSELLQTIFHKNTLLHDMAVIVRGDQVLAAGCLLPLSEHDFPDRHYGTRHRAAIGLTETSDALSVVISEETGAISLARNGRMVRNLDEARLRNLLHMFMKLEPVRKL